MEKIKNYSAISLIFLLVLFNELKIEAKDGILPSGIATEQTEAYVEEYVNQYKDSTAAVAVSIVSQNEEILQKVYGYTNIEKQTLANEETIFEWGPTTKLLTWISVMQLVEEGKLDLETDIKSYLPKGFLSKLKFEQAITLVDLMNNTAGWQDVAYDMRFLNEEDVPSFEIAIKQCEPIQIFEPGTQVAYSNYGSALAAYIVEQVSGKAFDTYVEENIFEPLGMSHTALYIKELKTSQSYTTQLKVIEESYRYNELYPCEGAVGTVGDLTRLIQALLVREDESSPLFKERETLNTLFTPTLYYKGTDIARNTHGFWAYEHTNTTIGHGGKTLGSSCQIALDLEEGIGTIIMVNQPDETIYSFDLMNQLMGKPSQKIYQGILPDVEDVAGYYCSARTIDKGFFKLYSLFNIIEVQAADKDSILFSYIMSDYQMEYQQVAPYTYTLKEGFPAYNFIKFNEADGRVQQLSTPNWDYIPIQKKDVIRGFGALIAMLLTFYYCMVATIVQVAKRLWDKACKKHRKVNRMSMAVLLINFFGAMIGINIGRVVIKAMRYTASGMDVKVSIIANLLYIVATLMYCGALSWHMKKIEVSKKTKIYYVLSAMIAVLLSSMILLWEMYY